MSHTTDPSEIPPEFDSALADTMIGKRVLVGVTVEDRRGQFKRQEQFHGVVVSASKEAGVQLELQGTRAGETKWLPPATNFYERAAPGVYKLRSTGESVSDPDYTCTWKLIQPDA
jgi:hypothetical protein